MITGFPRFETRRPLISHSFNAQAKRTNSGNSRLQPSLSTNLPRFRATTPPTPGEPAPQRVNTHNTTKRTLEQKIAVVRNAFTTINQDFKNGPVRFIRAFDADPPFFKSTNDPNPLLLEFKMGNMETENTNALSINVSHTTPFTLRQPSKPNLPALEFEMGGKRYNFLRDPGMEKRGGIDYTVETLDDSLRLNYERLLNDPSTRDSVSYCATHNGQWTSLDVYMDKIHLFPDLD